MHLKVLFGRFLLCHLIQYKIWGPMCDNERVRTNRVNWQRELAIVGYQQARKTFSMLIGATLVTSLTTFVELSVCIFIKQLRTYLLIVSFPFVRGLEITHFAFCTSVCKGIFTSDQINIIIIIFWSLFIVLTSQRKFIHNEVPSVSFICSHGILPLR